MIEFALIGVVLVLFLFGALDVGRYEAVLQSLRVAADAAGRAAVVAFSTNWANGCGAVPSGNTLQTSVVNSQGLPLLTPASLVISETCTGPDANGVLTVAVTARYPFTFVAPMLRSGPITLAANSSVSFIFPQH